MHKKKEEKKENDVIQTDSCVRHEMNILALSALEKQPGLFCVETFQFSKYFKNVFNSQLNLSSSTDVYGFKLVSALLYVP